MADTNLLIHVDQTTALDKQGREGKELLRRIINHFEGLLIGAARGNSVKVWADGTDPVQASGTVTIASGTGTITATINGVGISVTWATSDTNTATLLKNAINESTNALVQYIVTASSSAGVVTITAAQPGVQGNCITLAASGTGATASGARLTGGAGNNVSAVTITL